MDIDEWQKVRESGTYSGSSKDIEDGFIHFSGEDQVKETLEKYYSCLLYTSPSPRDLSTSRMPSSA